MTAPIRTSKPCSGSGKRGELLWERSSRRERRCPDCGVTVKASKDGEVVPRHNAVVFPKAGGVVIADSESGPQAQNARIEAAAKAMQKGDDYRHILSAEERWWQRARVALAAADAVSAPIAWRWRTTYPTRLRPPGRWHYSDEQPDLGFGVGRAFGASVECQELRAVLAEFGAVPPPKADE